MNEPELKKVSAEFYVDKQGVIVKIEMTSDFVFRAALFYDGRNQAVLGRNNKDFFLLKSIAPFIRQKILSSKTVTVMECSGNKVNQAYETEVVLVDHIDGDDTFVEDQKKYIQKLEEMYGIERVNKFKQKAREALHKLFS